MITLKRVAKRFGKVTAVDGLDLEVAEGEIFGLVGPDGAGKTTTIRMMLGIIDPSAGTITVLGEQNLERIKPQIGYVPQRFSLYGDLTVIENIRLMGAMYGAAREEIEARAEAILAFTNLLPFKKRLADNLSGGMKQKLALAAGLMHRPRIFFLDEPTTGVDPVSRREFWQMLYQLNQEGTTVLVSTPYMDEAELCTRVAFMNHGRITACGPPARLKQDYPYRLLELAAPSKQLRQVLAGCPGILDLNAFGEKYHLAVDDPQPARLAVESRLAAAGIEVRSIREIPPTMEDLFVHLANGGA
jgi:ABC-2 type transport system ATP-binding protein